MKSIRFLLVHSITMYVYICRLNLLEHCTALLLLGLIRCGIFEVWPEERTSLTITVSCLSAVGMHIVDVEHTMRSELVDASAIWWRL